MMKLRLFALATLLLTLPLSAAEKSGMMMPMPNPALDQMRWMSGKWECRGMAMAMGSSPQHATRARVTITPDLNGYWIAFRYQEEKNKENPMPMTQTGFWGYDDGSKSLVSSGVDSMGGYYSSSSSGFSGDAITFEGPGHMMGMTMNFRDVFTRNGAKELTHAGLMEHDGTWTKVDEETCHKK